jgi:hypothetical protein
MTPQIVRLPKGGGGGTLVDAAEPTTLGQRVSPSTGTRTAAVAPELGWARLTADDNDSLSLLCELGTSVPQITQGYPEWEEVERPKRISLTDWRGFKPLAIELPLWLDDFANDSSVEDAVDILEALAGRGRRRQRAPGSGDYIEPPRVIVDTHGVMPYDAQAFPDMRWVITDLDWDDDAAITNDHGNRVRAPVAVHLLQYVTDTRLQDRAFAARARTNAKRRGQHGQYTVKAGDTLPGIARRKLGDAGRWPEIARLNNIRDPRAIRAGAVLKIP